MGKYLSYMVAVIAITGALLSSISYFAKATDLKKVEQRLDYKIVSDMVTNTYNRMWDLEAKNGNRNVSQWSDKRDIEEYKKLKILLEELVLKRDNLIKKFSD